MLMCFKGIQETLKIGRHSEGVKRLKNLYQSATDQL
jgi:hypothetical protein